MCRRAALRIWPLPQQAARAICISTRARASPSPPVYPPQPPLCSPSAAPATTLPTHMRPSLATQGPDGTLTPTSLVWSHAGSRPSRSTSPSPLHPLPPIPPPAAPALPTPSPHCTLLGPSTHSTSCPARNPALDHPHPPLSPTSPWIPGACPPSFAPWLPCTQSVCAADAPPAAPATAAAVGEGCREMSRRARMSCSSSASSISAKKRPGQR